MYKKYLKKGYRLIDMTTELDKIKETTFSKTKAVLDEMIAERKKNVSVADTPELRKIFQDLYDKRNAVKKESQS